MKAVQTLWCGDRRLEESQFWWLDAEYHLMSWALSALKLRQHFDRLELYTDSEGARMLIDRLGLPYTEVKVVYDRFHCLTCHWALVKVHTYSLQRESFIHIDGDIYLTKPLTEQTLASPLIVQNTELCTDYYRRMIDRLLGISGLKLQESFRRVLESDDVPSCNLGFCGGTDIDFFGRFSEAVFRFFRDNDFNSDRFRNDDISANVVFEQIFFSIMAREAGPVPATIWPQRVRDNGYLPEEFSDMLHFGQRQFVHILGGMKRRKDICRSVELTLLREYPEMWRRVADLFPERHRLLHPAAPLPVASQGAPHYEATLRETVRTFAVVSPDVLIAEERAAADNIAGLAIEGESRDSRTLQLHPFLHLLPVDEAEREAVRLRLCPERMTQPCFTAVIPSVTGEGYVEIPLYNTERNIIALLSSPMTVGALTEALMPSFQSADLRGKAGKCASRAIDYLLSSGAVIAKTADL